MKKSFVYYLSSWLFLLVIFNIFAFVLGTFTVAFWLSYALVSACFLVQLACSVRVIAFDMDKDKRFLNCPVMYLGTAALIVSFALAILFFAVPFLPTVVCTIAVIAITLFYGIAILAAGGAAEIVSDVDNKIKNNTLFIKEMTVKAETFVNEVVDSNSKSLCKQIVEALKYSDPVSSVKLAEIEEKIKSEMFTLSEAITANRTEEIEAVSRKILQYIADRDKMCKLYK